MAGLTDIEVRIHHTTDKAVLVSTDDETKVWLPLSTVEIEWKKGGLAIITLPERLAIDKGLV